MLRLSQIRSINKGHVRKYYRVLAVPLLCFSSIWLIWAAFAEKLTIYQVCLGVVWLVALTTTIVNNFRNKAITEGASAVSFATLALWSWLPDKDVVATAVYALLATLCLLGMVDALSGSAVGAEDRNPEPNTGMS